METIVKDSLLSFLTSKGLITKQQHAFLKRRSTTTNLLDSIHDWFVTLCNRMSIDSVYVDFAKAFDSIVFSKLLIKLESYGICGELLTWIEAFLKERHQCVKVESCLSDWVPVVSGVPQGSVLGPVLFIIFINDITEICCGQCKMNLFADDLKIYTSVPFGGTSLDLQNSLNRLAEWSTKWQLGINCSKCFVMRIGNFNHVLPEYNIGSVKLSVENKTSDLGIQIDNNLGFREHITKITSQAKSRIGILFRSFATRNIVFLRKAFITYVRPLLEYSTNVWNPHFIQDVDLLESVQRKFTKRIPELRNLPYLERLALLDLEPLELRRLRFDLVSYYNILNGISPVSECCLVSRSTIGTTRSRCNYLVKLRKGSQTCLHSFFNYQIDCWNSLPLCVTESNSVCVFKKQLRSVDLSRFLIGSVFTFT